MRASSCHELPLIPPQRGRGGFTVIRFPPPRPRIGELLRAVHVGGGYHNSVRPRPLRRWIECPRRTRRCVFREEPAGGRGLVGILGQQFTGAVAVIDNGIGLVGLPAPQAGDFADGGVTRTHRRVERDRACSTW